MGTVGSRPSCLGEKSPRSEDFLKDSYLRGVSLEAGCPTGGKNNAAESSPPEKPPWSPRVIENGWSTARLGAPRKACPSSPLPKRNNVDVDMQTGGPSCNRLKARLELGSWGITPFRSSGGSWAWKPSLAPATAATEVTEVTEVTETVVTEIVEVTEYPGGERSQQPVVTRTVKVLAECAGALPEVNRLLCRRGGAP